MSRFRLMFLFLFLPSLAYADWQYTRWGMSPDDVVKASAGVATPDPNSRGHSTDDSESLLTAPYTRGRFAFSAHFLFDRRTHMLSRVDLQLKDPRQCYVLWGELYAGYGKPQSESKRSGVRESAHWRDADANNGIAIVKIGDNLCSVTYWALKGTDTKGW